MYGVKDETWESILNILKQYDQIEKAVLYGSRAKGTYKNGSDIDLSLKGKDLNTGTLLKIMDRIDDLYLPYEFDISIYDSIENVELKNHIDRVGIIIYNSVSGAPTEVGGEDVLMDQRQIDEGISKFVERVILEYNPKKIVLFGSYVNGDHHENSDIDIAVIVDGYSDSFIDGKANLFRIRREILSDIEPILIDVNEDKSGFLEHILSYGKTLYEQ